MENNRCRGRFSASGWMRPDVTVGQPIRGDISLRSQDRGNGIHLFNTTGR